MVQDNKTIKNVEIVKLHIPRHSMQRHMTHTLTGAVKNWCNITFDMSIVHSSQKPVNYDFHASTDTHLSFTASMLGLHRSLLLC